MDGFDAFDAPAAAPTDAPAEVDPAAEFLAQEQEDLGGLGEDLGFTSPPQDVQAPIVNGGSAEEISMDAGVSDFFGVPPPSGMQMESSPVENMTSGMSNMKVREEPEVIKKWKIEQEEKLRSKDAEEEKKKEELREQAKKELEDWYKHYEEQLEKTKETNRSAQETFVSEVNDIQPGTEWERVAKQCDFNAKTSRNTKDVSRMRGILLQLKQSPPTRD
eukprot:TRINITY_DN7708_c0_g1_i1.p1 TRINITY_DN7708_c0_g1~~TRINITY_DN7708_c0_g1_i1.p1  ORF type:complete len:218 (+),score=72.05 TRINITY_DN7708_c0_g1_i1:56-709(+)